MATKAYSRKQCVVAPSLNGVGDVSAVLRSQVRMLSELADGLRRRRLRFVISNPSERVFAMLERSGLLDTIGALRYFVFCSRACTELFACCSKCAASCHSNAVWLTAWLLLRDAGREFVFVRIHDAVEYCKYLMAADGADVA
jgi:hypothetical protein